MENKPKKTTPRRKPEDILIEIEGKIDVILSRLETAINSTRSSKSLYEQRLDKGGEKNVIEPLLDMLNKPDGEIKVILDELKNLFKEHEIKIDQNKVVMKLTRRSKPIEVKGSLAKKLLKIERQQLFNNYSEEQIAFIEKIEGEILRTLCIFDENDHSTSDFGQDKGFYISKVSTISIPSEDQGKVELLPSLKVEVTEKPNNDSRFRIDDKEPIKVILPYPFVRIISLNSKDAFFDEMQIIAETEKIKLLFFADYNSPKAQKTDIRTNLNSANISIVSENINGKTVFFAQQIENGRIQARLRIDETLAENIVGYMKKELHAIESKAQDTQLPEDSDENNLSIFRIYQFCLEAYARGYEVKYCKPISRIANNTIAEEEYQIVFNALPFGTPTIPEIDQVLQIIFERVPYTQEDFEFIMENVKSGNDGKIFLQNLEYERKMKERRQRLDNFTKAIGGTRIATALRALGNGARKSIDTRSVWRTAQLLASSMENKASSEELGRIYNTIELLKSDMQQELGVPEVGLKDMIRFLENMVGKLPRFKVKIEIKRPEKQEKFTAPKSEVMTVISGQFEKEPVIDAEGKVIREERVG